MPLDANCNSVYYIWYGIDRLSAARGWINQWKNLGNRGALSAYEKVPHVDMPFVCCSEKAAHANRLVQALLNNVGQPDNAISTHSL